MCNVQINAFCQRQASLSDLQGVQGGGAGVGTPGHQDPGTSAGFIGLHGGASCGHTDMWGAGDTLDVGALQHSCTQQPYSTAVLSSHTVQLYSVAIQYNCTQQPYSTAEIISHTVQLLSDAIQYSCNQKPYSTAVLRSLTVQLFSGAMHHSCTQQS